MGPLNVYVDSIKTHQTLTLHWSPPPFNSIHGDLLNYKIKVTPIKTGIDLYDEPPSDTYVVHPSLSSLFLNFMKPNTEYEFDILAINEHGDGVSTVIMGSKLNLNYFKWT